VFQIKGPGKTIEERRSSLDAEIDSLTSILADLESSSPYKPRTPQVPSLQTLQSPLNLLPPHYLNIYESNMKPY